MKKDFGIFMLIGVIVFIVYGLTQAQKAAEPLTATKVTATKAPVSYTRVGNTLIAYRGDLKTINDTTKTAIYDTVKTPCSSDTVTVEWYETAKWWYIVKGKSVKNIYGVHTPNSGFTIGRTKRGGKWIKTEYAIDDKAGTHAIYNVMMGDSIDPGYAAAPQKPSLVSDLLIGKIRWVGIDSLYGYPTCAIASTPIEEYPRRLDTLLQLGKIPQIVFMQGGESNVAAGQTSVQIVDEWTRAIDSISAHVTRAKTSIILYHLCSPKETDDEFNDTTHIVDSILATIEDSINTVHDSVTYEYIGGSGMIDVDLVDAQHPSQLGNLQWARWFGDSLTKIGRNNIATCIGQSKMRPYTSRQINYAIDSVIALREGANPAILDGAVHYWSMDDTLDRIGTNHGELVNGAQITEGGIYGDYLSCSADSQYMDHGDVTALNAVTAFTISFWTNVADSSSNRSFFRKLTADSQIVMFTLTGNIRVYCGKSVSGAQYISTPVTNLASNKWQHIVVRFSSTADTTIQLWINGKNTNAALTGESPTKSPNLAGESFKWGRTTTTVSINGGIDNALIYNRALTDNEIWLLSVATRPTWRADTTNGVIRSDTLLHKQQVDTTFIISNKTGRTDTIIFSTGKSTKSARGLWGGEQDSSFDTVGGSINLTENWDFPDTVKVWNANNAGVSDTIIHSFYVCSETTTVGWGVVATTNPGIYKNPIYKKKTYRHSIYKNPVWYKRDEDF